MSSCLSTSRPVALVTGGTRGIGLAIAEALAARGFDLGISSTKASAETEAICADLAQKHGARVVFSAGNLGVLDDHSAIVAPALEAFGRIDCLVNNAGMAAPVRGDVLALRPENFDSVVNVNLRGTMFLTQRVVNHMLATPSIPGVSRSILHITSVSAAMASPERLDYCISKAGLAMWSQGLALRLAGEGISVFEVRPGIIRTDMTAGVAGKYDQAIADGLVPMRRWGEGADISSIVAALAGGGFGFATGSVIMADGGLSLPRL
ncbi:3-ketoacyl-ACP reductase [Elstera cyanobacteriorum]|uniref:3-ketoacyl-ACP reductase n=1 Tax=Elstera cyanobacteriorum TaxID=2022747 RepID=A0A255Y1V4_9PROT|nr:3-ketoacyl-ACP reductase [Elstera cyanobacteriorum]OYQ22470.1 3-ketoacyl-ACP reductase [Elstera cyanobacteriorum]GGA03024.1 3-ketoacyl-ACP reductase [Elstera cyanobacteriorum]